MGEFSNNKMLFASNQYKYLQQLMYMSIMVVLEST